MEFTKIRINIRALAIVEYSLLVGVYKLGRNGLFIGEKVRPFKEFSFLGTITI